MIYEGRLLDASRDPIATSVTIRFSLWSGSDWVAGDETASGAINTGATLYGGWQELHTLTPGAAGVISIRLGSVTSLPTIVLTNHQYLQVEVKNTGDADTLYQLLDPTGDDGGDTDDRKYIGSVPYAKVTELLQNRGIGTGSGDIVLLGSGDTIPIDVRGNEINENTFVINADQSAGDTTLTFGNALLNETLTFNAITQRFEFSDDVHVDGTISASGGLSIAGNVAFLSGFTIRGQDFLTHIENSGSIINASGSITLHPHFPGAAYHADGSSNVGQLSVLHDLTNRRNYYEWTTSRSALQDYTIMMHVTIPDAFQEWNSSPFTLYYRTISANTAENEIDVTLVDTAGATVTTDVSTVDLANTSWTALNFAPTGSPTWTPGGTIQLHITPSALTSFGAHVGEMHFSYKEKLNASGE